MGGRTGANERPHRAWTACAAAATTTHGRDGLGRAVALMKDLPAMLLGTSRLMFAWAEDGIFPAAVARVHPVRRTPDTAILASGAMATAGILGSHLAGDFFLGVDILVISMLINFLVMSVAVLTLPGRNPGLAARVRVVPQRGAQVVRK